MASLATAAACALLGLAYWSLVGYPLARRLVPAPLAAAFAPLIGWSVHSVLALLVFFAVPFSGAAVAAVGLLCLAASLAAADWDRRRAVAAGRLDAEVDADTDPRRAAAQGAIPLGAIPQGAIPQAAIPQGLLVDGQPGVPWPALFCAALLAVAIAAAVAPKTAGDAVHLSDQIFDHSKAAIIDEMTRDGLPPGNPFFADDGAAKRLAYYYLWHFSAAELAEVTGASGWEADLAMTFFSALTSLAVMMALAARLSGQRSSSYFVVLIALGSSARTLAEALVGTPRLEEWLPAPGGLGGWLFQSAWVPQHLIASSCVLTSFFLMSGQTAEETVQTGLRERIQAHALPTGILALVIAAGVEASTWVGGIAFALALVVVAPFLWATLAARRRGILAGMLIAAGVLAVLLAGPLLRDEAAAAAQRQAGFPVAFEILPVLGDAVSQAVRRVLDVPAFWLLLLPFELTAAFLVGVAAFAWLVRGPDPTADRAFSPRLLARLYALVALASLAAAGMLTSTLAQNNDLGWREGLLGSTALIAAAGAGCALLLGSRRWLLLVLAAATLAPGAPETVRQIAANIAGHPRAEDAAFAGTVKLWAAVRTHSGPNERVANNPSAFARMTPWPVNISWALLSDRPSCYAGWELTQVYTSVPHPELYRIDVLFKRVFAGDGSAEDVAALAQRYDCTLAVILASDGAWTRDPFQASPLYHLVQENPGHWRIYRRTSAAR